MTRAEAAARRAEVVRLCRAGMRPAEIADRLGMWLSFVYLILREAGVKPPPAVRRPKVSAHCAGQRDLIDQVLDAWADGLSAYDLSLLTKRSEAAIRQILLRARRKGDPRAAPRRPATVLKADPWAAIRALRDRAHVAAEYRIGGSPHEWTDEDSLAMARFVLAACEVIDAP